MLRTRIIYILWIKINPQYNQCGLWIGSSSPTSFSSSVNVMRKKNKKTNNSSFFPFTQPYPDNQETKNVAGVLRPHRGSSHGSSQDTFVAFSFSLRSLYLHSSFFVFRYCNFIYILVFFIAFQMIEVLLFIPSATVSSCCQYIFQLVQEIYITFLLLFELQDVFIFHFESDEDSAWKQEIEGKSQREPPWIEGNRKCLGDFIPQL